MGGTSPLGNGRRVGTKGGIINLVDKDSEESGGLLTRVGLELRLDIEDKCGSDRREQTSLVPFLACTHWDLTQDSRRLELCLNPRRTSSGTPYHILPPLSGSTQRI